MWFELINTAIAATGLGLASMSFLKLRSVNFQVKVEVAGVRGEPQ